MDGRFSKELGGEGRAGTDHSNLDFVFGFSLDANLAYNTRQSKIQLS